MTKNTEVAKQGTTEITKAFLKDKKAELIKLLPKHIDYDRFAKSAGMAVFKSTQLQKCSHASIMTSIFTAAELGLDFTPTRGHAYLVPFGAEATFIPGWRGLIDLARRTGVVKKMEARVVYENDEFSIEYGLKSDLKHKPDLKKRGGMIGAYAVAHIADAEPIFEYMTLEELDKIRNDAISKNSPAWKNHKAEMYRKTAIRRLFKYLPISTELEKAIEWETKMSGMANAPAIEIEPEVSADHVNENVDDIPDAEIVEDETGDAPELKLGDEDPREYTDVDDVT